MAVSQATEFAGPELELDEMYPCKILTANEVENKFGTDPRVNLVLELIDEDRQPLINEQDGKPIQIFNYINVSANSGKKSKLYQIWSGMFYGGKDIPDDEVMDTDQLVGLYARFFWGMVVAPDKSQKPGVVRMTALKKASPAVAAAKTSALEDAIDKA